ncbi:3'-phosphoesterase [Candidatus Pacearchaeota archaeon]|nr:3'-phosphoesterase [Candidatus Pacearchaeota archaeon]
MEEIKKTKEKNVRLLAEAKKKSRPSVLRGESTREIKGFSRIFVIHEHHATHLHWDLRLEMNGVLKSWAIPKQPPKRKGIKRLAIQVPDHDLSYAKFQGTIPEGNYGAGEVKIWDKGTYELTKKTPKEILFTLYGKKLKGKYCLIKTNYLKNKKSWLLIKVQTPFSRF